MLIRTGTILGPREPSGWCSGNLADNYTTTTTAEIVSSILDKIMSFFFVSGFRSGKREKA